MADPDDPVALCGNLTANMRLYRNALYVLTCQMFVPSGITLGIQAGVTLYASMLAADGGDVELVEVSAELDVILRLTGACSTCSMSEMTMTAGIEESLKRAIPNIGKITALKN